MALFEIQHPDGSTYEVDAPDQDAAIAAFKTFTSPTPAAAPVDRMRPAATDPDLGPITAPGQTPVMPAAPTNPNGKILPSVRPDAGRNLDDAVRMVADGATLGTMPKIAARAAAATGWGGKAGDYAGNLATERSRDTAIEAENPIIAPALKIAGGALGTGALAAAGVPVLGGSGGLLARIVRGGAATGIVEGVAGAVKADGHQAEKIQGFKSGAAVGGAVGAGGPIAGRAIEGAWNGLAGVVRGHTNPNGFAMGQVGRALERAGKSPEEIAAAQAAARTDGQDMYAVADAMGSQGQRLLSTATKAPGPGQDFGERFLEARQAGASRRVSDNLREGFEAPETAAQATQQLKAARAETTAPMYDAARRDAVESGAKVDVGRAVGEIDSVLAPGGIPIPGDGIGKDTIESALAQARKLLTNGQATRDDFDTVFRAKRNVDRWIERAEKNQDGTLMSYLGPVRDKLDEALANASGPYAHARDTYAAMSRDVDAVGLGKKAGATGRSEDVVDRFGKLSPSEQVAFRVGYADPYIAAAENVPNGGTANFAGRLMAPNVQAEFPAIAGDRGETMLRQARRENDMWKTRQVAIGGSSTAGTLRDMAEEGGVGPGTEYLAQILRNPTGILGHVLDGARRLGGSTPESRDRLAKILLSTDGEALASSFAAEQAGRERTRTIANLLGRAVVSGGAAAVRP